VFEYNVLYSNYFTQSGHCHVTAYLFMIIMNSAIVNYYWPTVIKELGQISI